MKSTVYGPPQAWNSKQTDVLGLLVSALDKKTLSKIRPAAMEGLSADTIDAMGSSQLRSFLPEQLDWLPDLSLAAYLRKTGISSGGNMSFLSWLYLIATVYVNVGK